MIGNIVARRYARAIFALGRRKGLADLEKFGSELADLCSAIDSSPAMGRLLRAPVFSMEEKHKVLEQLFNHLNISAEVRNFCFLMAEKSRLAELSAIAAVYKELLDAEKGIIRGELVTAVELDSDKRNKVREQLEKQAGRPLELSFAVDEGILGGVMLKVGDQIMDASLRAQLSILKDSIKRGE